MNSISAACLATVCLAALIGLAVLTASEPAIVFITLSIITLLAGLVCLWWLFYIGLRS